MLATIAMVCEMSSTVYQLLSLQHGDLDPGPARGLDRRLVARVRVPRDADAGIVREHAPESPPHLRRAARDDALPRVQRVPDADAAAMVKAHPAGATRDVEERVQDRPVGDRVAAVAQALRLAERRRDAS